MGLIDEVRDAEEQPINEIVLPLLNVSRRLPDNTVNEKEPNQQRIFATSAGFKTSFSYDLLLDVFENSIIDPQNSFCFGCDYRVPAMHGLVDITYINKLKMSPSYNEESFAREYISNWAGASEEAWFNYDKLSKYRKLKNPETHAFFRVGVNMFYLLSVDVGRIHDQTVVTVFKVTIDKMGKHYATVVNVFVLGKAHDSKTFKQQAIELKRIIRDFKPKEIVIDTNGLGVGFGDEMTQTQIDEFGEMYPGYGFFNDDDFLKTQPKGIEKILYGLKANGPLKSKIHGNCYARINSGMVHFLIREQDAKTALLSTKTGQKMTMEQRVKRLMPHEMTTKLFEEMANLRLKKTGVSGDIVLEQINTRFPDDKYMSFAYGLWRIKELEEEYVIRNRRRFGQNSGERRLVFFTEGGT